MALRPDPLRPESPVAESVQEAMPRGMPRYFKFVVLVVMPGYQGQKTQPELHPRAPPERRARYGKLEVDLRVAVALRGVLGRRFTGEHFGYTNRSGVFSQVLGFIPAVAEVVPVLKKLFRLLAQERVRHEFSAELRDPQIHDELRDDGEEAPDVEAPDAARGRHLESGDRRASRKSGAPWSPS